jgi:hypothetical protein
VRPAFLSGNSRTRLPDAAKYALTMAGAPGAKVEAIDGKLLRCNQL